MDQVKQVLQNRLRIAQGDVVIGFFLDGDDAQLPVIIGVIGNSKYVVNGHRIHFHLLQDILMKLNQKVKL